MKWDALHNPNYGKAVAFISREAAELFNDAELCSLLRERGVNTKRPTRITERGAVYYTDEK